MNLLPFLLAVLSLALAACKASVSGVPESAPPAQGIEGQYVFRGPGINMDCAEFPAGAGREECEEANTPFATPIVDAVIEVRGADGELEATAVTNFDGEFSVTLGPGDYLVCAESCEGPVAVRVGEFTRYDLSLLAP